MTAIRQQDNVVGDEITSNDDSDVIQNNDDSDEITRQQWLRWDNKTLMTPIK